MQKNSIFVEIFITMQLIQSNISTIRDVAKKAGVARATVDRVLFNRGYVSQKTREKVLAAIKDLDYRPNTNASQLASRKEYHIACLIPEFHHGDYWEEMNNGLIASAKDHAAKNISVTFYYFDQNDEEGFINNCNSILESQPDGVMLSVVFPDFVANFCKELEEKHIRYAFIDNKIDKLDYNLYYGIDSYKNGQIGAWFLTTRTDPKDIALIRIIRDPRHKSDPNRTRRHGFTDYIEDVFPACRIHTVFIDPENPEQIMEELESFFSQNPSIKQIAMTSSRVFLLRDYLRKHPDSQRIVVGFDDIKKNLDCLREGLIDCLVIRHIKQQAYNALTTFAEYLIRNNKSKHTNHFVHMEILTKSNMDS